METHINRVVGHYKSKVGVWDVVNEPISDRGGLRPSVFERRLGEGFVATAFRLAHAADPDAKLYLNEIGAEGINAKSNRLYELLSGLKSQGVPVDGVGFQVHSNLDGLPGDFVANMQRFAALGLDIAITEADVGLRLTPNQQDLEAQARIYEQIVRSCLTVIVQVADVLGLQRPVLVDLRDAARDGRGDAAGRQVPAQAGVLRGAEGAGRLSLLRRVRRGEELARRRRLGAAPALARRHMRPRCSSPTTTRTTCDSARRRSRSTASYEVHSRR